VRSAIPVFIISLVMLYFYGCAQQQSSVTAPSPIKSRADLALDKYEAIINEYEGILKKANNPTDFQMKQVEFSERVSEWSKEWNSISGEIDSAESSQVQERLNRLNQKVTYMCRPKTFQ
jgi:hypothetical protein